MKVLIFDPFAGISGDMLLGALIDLGLDGAWLERFVAELGLGDIKVHIERATRRGIDSGRVYFDLPHEHTHRHLRHVVEIINGSNASAVTKARAVAAFGLLARAEAEVHGTSIEKVHFHEVGALDAILDVLCAMAGIEQLGFDAFCTRPVAVGQGWVSIEHGRFPVPAPATLKLLDGIAVTGTDLPGECTTPTGAAILAVLTEGKAAPAAFRVLGSGYGAGTRDPEDRPNVLRLIACEIEPAGESLYVVQADVDDLAAEYVPAAQEALLRAGALDAVISNIAMKKGRPGVRFEALVPSEALEEVLKALFASTTTIGARYWAVQRPALPRTETEVEWRGQRIRRKEVRLPDGTVRSKAEYEDVLRAAEALGISALEVRREVDTITGGR
ncbi:MAG TPA: nickel pincer cofactor biosynthesis protein LarC [Longimicrobiales bacterium]